jgi:hypothetical protein
MKWVQSCSLIHDDCRTVNGAAASDESKLPTRLIEIGDAGSLTVRVRETSELQQSEFEGYMTLSHCWGAVVPKKLTTDNYLSMLEGIALSDMPATFLEAIRLTRRLGVRYLWIDSLCIIQDSSEDWGTESVRMFDIYRNSYLNIGAAGASDANGGLFSSLDSGKTLPCVLTIGIGENSRYIASEYEPKNSYERDEQCALFGRAWVFQELFLAPRTLFFGKDELFWECRRLRGTETIPEQAEHHPGYDGLRMATRELWENLDDQNYQSRLGVWFELVRQYSNKQLTKVSDKLVAVSGLASHLGSSWGDVSYLAGLWSFRLRRGLLWHVAKPQLKKDKTFIAPSWSWASTTGTVIPSGFSALDTFEENLSELRDGIIEVLDASTTLDSSYSLYGPVLGGQVRVKGPLMRGKIMRVPGIDWELDFKDCGAVFSDLDQHVLEKIPMFVDWDDWEMDDMTEGINIYLAPFEIHLRSNGYLVLEGLLLLPTHLARGQYRRLGYFSVEDNLLRSRNQDAETGLSQEINSVQINGFNDDRVHHVNAKLSPPVHYTVLDVTAVLANTDKKDKLMGLKCSSSSNSGPFQKMKKRLDPWQDCPSLSKESLVESEDPYWNGAVNPKLLNRYHDTLNKFEYERINSLFAALTWAIFKEGLVGGCQVPNEEDHGNDYFTFSIV